MTRTIFYRIFFFMFKNVKYNLLDLLNMEYQAP